MHKPTCVVGLSDGSGIHSIRNWDFCVITLLETIQVP